MDNGYKHCDICNCVQPKLGVCSNGHVDKTGVYDVDTYKIIATPIRNVYYIDVNKDLEYLQKKLFEALRIPKELLGYEEEKKCECGAEKCNTTHSEWCPKHKV